MYKFFSKGEGTLITKKIESGKQLGIALRVYKNQQYSWYSYAVQKKDNIYYILIYFHKKKLFNPDFSETTILVNGTNNEKPRYELSPLNLTTSHQDNSS